jgi:hypothetical protein
MVERSGSSRGDRRGTRGCEGGNVFDLLAVILHRRLRDDDDREAKADEAMNKME